MSEQSQEQKNCPFCGEQILAVAKKCKHCGEFLDDAKTGTLADSRYSYKRKSFRSSSRNALLIGIAIIGAWIIASFVLKPQLDEIAEINEGTQRMLGTLPLCKRIDEFEKDVKRWVNKKINEDETLSKYKIVCTEVTLNENTDISLKGYAIFQDLQTVPVEVVETENGYTYSCSLHELNLHKLKPKHEYTLDMFSRIENGMTYGEVAKVVGEKGELLSSSSIGGLETEMYIWQKPDGANFNVTIQDGFVVMKSQFGLKGKSNSSSEKSGYEAITESEITRFKQFEVLYLVDASPVVTGITLGDWIEKILEYRSEGARVRFLEKDRNINVTVIIPEGSKIVFFFSLYAGNSCIIMSADVNGSQLSSTDAVSIMKMFLDISDAGQEQNILSIE